MITKETWINGLRNGIDTIWELAKVIIPLTIVIAVLKETGYLELLAKWMEPLMQVLGLPGEAALALVVGYFVNIYSAIAVILALSLTVKQVTIVSVMIAICHGLFLESAITKRTGIKAWPLALMRLGISILAGLGVNWLY
ncbi:MAG: nucleoside recognition protein [Firmicutes bacterium]|mgnify:CR=1 FL=1|nr:nucleoside recognition protein [Bacillota bacterium]